MNTVFGYRGTVNKVTDGDTVVGDFYADNVVDVGFNVTQSVTSILRDQKMRMAGVDAKPIQSVPGTQADAWLESKTEPGKRKQVYFSTIKNKLGAEEHEKYGRWLVYIFLLDEAGEIIQPSLNEQMIELGLAQPWDGRGPHPV